MQAPIDSKKLQSAGLALVHEVTTVSSCTYTLVLPGACPNALQRHGDDIRRDVEGEIQPGRHSNLSIGPFPLDIAEARITKGELHLFVAIDRTLKFAWAGFHKAAALRRAPVHGGLTATVLTPSIPS